MRVEELTRVQTVVARRMAESKATARELILGVDADEKSLGEIGRDARRLAGRVRASSVTPPELAGGTFTVSNLGMFGISEFSSILNPPQAAILSAGEIWRIPVECDGEIALRHVMMLRLTCDHRILYGADAAGFLQRIEELLEQPLAMSL